jgi:L-ascorbate metabolism protein UlaG (beta-lactamase superfamily)
MTKLGRRALVAGAAGMSFAEVLSLGGTFDHRRTPAPSARERFLASYAETETCGVVHVGHSTHVVCAGGRRVLTDPWFSDPAFGALAHAVPPACALDDLASVDAIAVSHAHPDHADLTALDGFADKSRATVLVGTDELAKKLTRRGFRSVRVLSLWEAHDLGGAIVHAVPAVHDVPEIGFVIAAGHTSVLFAGDSGLHSALAAVRERYRPSFAILPVDGTRLRGSSQSTMNALEAVQAARALGVRGVMPSHVEARYTDPFAEHLLTANAHAGSALFRLTMTRELPDVRCDVPLPGARIAV